MATTLQFLDKEGLVEFKALMTSYIDASDAAAIKGVGMSADGKKMLFYKEEPISGATAAYEITLPETDLSTYMKLATAAVEGNLAIFDANGQVTDAGKKLADFATAAQGALAESAVQSVTTGTANGTISVDGVDVAVYGLGDIAFMKSTDFERAGAVAGLKTELEADIKANTDAIGVLNGDAATEGSVAKKVADAEAALNAKIDDAVADIEADMGDLETLGTTNKDDLVSAINEVRSSVSAGGTAAVVTMETSTTTEGMLKSYTIKQGDTVIGTIDIPKDLVVASGEVVTNPEGQEEGTYIVLTIANADAPLYINVGHLVDIYKVAANAAQVQLAINSDTREISAHILAGSIGTDELADSAVTTVKIADGNVTKAKLSTAVQSSLNKADSALQAADIADLETDVAANKAALAEGGSTANAIKAAQDAADEAQATADAITDYVGTYEGDAENVVAYIDEKIAEVQGDGNTSLGALADRVTANEEAIADINDTETGILAEAKKYADTQDATTKAAALAYTDALANGAVADNTAAIATNKTATEANAAAIKTNQDNISTNTAAIDALEEALAGIGAIPISDIQEMFNVNANLISIV